MLRAPAWKFPAIMSCAAIDNFGRGRRRPCAPSTGGPLRNRGGRGESNPRSTSETEKNVRMTRCKLNLFLLVLQQPWARLIRSWVAICVNSRIHYLRKQLHRKSDVKMMSANKPKLLSWLKCSSRASSKSLSGIWQLRRLNQFGRKPL
eukprot:XP_021128769.2 uncharacterized protein LOC101797785 isoform X1 [Anas platyrhynchos]